MLFTITDEADDQKVMVLPITHTAPHDAAHAVEIPAATKRRLGLDDDRSWIVVTEANRFTWPGPDLRPAQSGNPSSVTYGELPSALFEQVREKWLAQFKAQKARVVVRTE